ncbi:M15 family metallopeptidase [Nocardioides bigeumensis]|uniref:D-alanyl-D-alanine carboxypeptidase-like core domain-containing protein n=1 Tax=Nocardioides bigeumensis TaxID=433657 RepID=A0ABP5J9C5_9ACTN
MRRTTVPLVVAATVAVGATLASVLGWWTVAASPRSSSDGVIDEDDGVIGGTVVTAYDEVPAVTRLDGQLRRALRRAASAAARDGIELRVNSGWRSRAYQAQLFRDAVTTYGSEAEAARWVATADTSSHVTGDAVDVGPYAASEWLARQGAAYGLCQTFGNEPWHFELRPGAVDDGCPPPVTDATHAQGITLSR